MKRQMRLTTSDKQEIKQMTRIGFVIPVMILVVAGILNLYFLVEDIFIGNLQYILFIDLGLVFICAFIFYRMNNKHYKDLNNGLKKILLSEVIAKEDKTSYEAGSGTLYIPILGSIFPKLWSQKAKPEHLLYLIIDKHRYRVDKDLYNKINNGEKVEMHYSLVGNTLLSIEKPKVRMG